MISWPLMTNNVTRQDLLCLQAFLAQPDMPRLTNGSEVRRFEEEFAAWLGVKYAVMVNSGSSANLITMQALRILHGVERVLVPCITWVSDIAAVLHAGMKPIFVDVEPETLGMSQEKMQGARADAIFVTHCLGFVARISHPRIPAWLMVEDCCESLGATFFGKKTWGLMSNFSFYYAHHMTTIEGGMVCTDERDCYETLRRLRSHGLVREMTPSPVRDGWAAANPTLDPEFIFTHPAYNVRPTELNAVLGRSQLKRVDAGIAARTDNLKAFLDALDSSRYRTNYRVEGSSNYALPLVLVNKDSALFGRVLDLLRTEGVEYRKGTAGGGNQLRQPYAKRLWGADFHKEFPEAEHISDYGLYCGNFPDLERWKIEKLCEKLNRL